MSALCTQHSTSRFGAQQACSAAARVTSSPVHLGQPLLPALAVWVSSCTRRLLTPRCAACGSTLQWVCFSLRGLLRHPSRARLCARCTCTGADGCVFPSATAGVFMHRIAYVITLDPLFRGVVWHRGRPDVFSRSRLTTTSSPLLSSPTLLLVTSSRSAGDGFRRTLFSGVVRAVSQFKA